MDDFTRRRPLSLKSRQRSWCCSFAVPPASPENLKSRYPKPDRASKPGSNSAPYSSPQSLKSGLNLNLVNRIDPRRILSPGRVSPIDSDPAVESIPELGPSQTQSPAADITVPRSRSGSFRAPNEGACLNSPCSGHGSGSGSGSGSGDGDFYDVRLKLKGRRGGCLVLEMNSGVLCANSVVFAGLIDEFNKKNNKNYNNRNNGGLFEKNRNVCRIEVPDVENLGVFRQTIELMFEENDNLTKRLLKIGVYRCIDILEISAGIMFTKGVSSCLKYLEAVPWTEEEEEKLRSLFTRFKFDEATTRDILSRLYLHDAGDSQQNLARQLVWSITTCSDTNARNELKSLVKGLLCRSSVYEKDQPDLNKEDFYIVCQSCLGSLVNLFDEASGNFPQEKVVKEDRSKPFIERISRQVDNINWLLEILLDRQMGEEFVDLWADQGKLLKLHENASPMIRYELSRVSANLFIAMGTRKLHCPSEARSALFQAWFGPMLSDFGWLQRCRKGLEMKTLEETMGQTLLTLPLKQQYTLFMEWFRCFSKHGTECPNLSKPFQIWWRRSFLRGSETNAIESR